MKPFYLRELCPLWVIPGHGTRTPGGPVPRVEPPCQALVPADVWSALGSGHPEGQAARQRFAMKRHKVHDRRYH